MADTVTAEPAITTPNARKRKSSTSETGRVVKHRSSTACQACRARKVRCDVVNNGSRCTNCRLDGMECIVLASRRGKNNHASRKSTDTAAPAKSEKATSILKSADRRDTDQTGYEDHSPSNAAGQVPVGVTFDQDHDNTEAGQQAIADDIASTGTYRGPYEGYDGLLTPETAMNTLEPQTSRPPKPPLPPFIMPLSNLVLSEDLAFLAQKGALTVPEPDLQMEILRGYLFSVHPNQPMLDFKQFVSAILNNSEENQISLLLFQAVMFAGLHGLPLHVIHRLGFESTKQAREVFFNRARLLYEFDIEPNSAAVVQSLILMSAWFTKGNERRHTWHYLGLGYDVARSMALHREPTTRYPPDVRRFRRRLWWSLYIRDRMIALGTRRPMRIKDEDFDVQMLTLEDFDLEPVELFLQGQPLMPDARENTSTALMCIELAKLGIIIGHVTSSQYTTLSAQPDVPHTMMIVSRRDAGRFQELERCDLELNDWFQALGPNVRRTSATSGDPQSCSEVHWAFLNLTYWVAVNVLHRSLALQPPPETAEAQAAQRISKSKVKDAARRLTKSLQSLMQLDQARFLGLIGVTAPLAACLTHMLDISSGDEDVRDASTFRLYQTVQVLHLLRGIYASADAAVQFLASVFRTAGITVHIPPPDSPTELAAVQALPGSAVNGQQSSGPMDPPRVPNDRGVPGLGWPADPSPMIGQAPADSDPRIMQNPDQQLIPAVDAMDPTPGSGVITPSVFAASTPSALPKDHPSAENGISQFFDASFGRPLGAGADGPLLEWNNNMELESMAFNYDFYSDAYGFLDGRFPSIQQ